MIQTHICCVSLYFTDHPLPPHNQTSQGNPHNIIKHRITTSSLTMDTNFKIPRELENSYRDLLTAGPVNQHARRKHDRTKSAGYGECTLELASQVLCGRVQSTDHKRVDCPPHPSNVAEPSFGEFPKIGVPGITFSDMLTCTTTSPVLLQDPTLQDCPSVEGAEAANITLPVHLATSSKYTAAQIAERKALKKERQIQKKEERQKELQANKLLLVKQRSPMVEILDQVPPQDPLVTAETSKQTRCLPAGSCPHELPRQIDVSRTTPPTMHSDDPATTPVKPSAMLLEASEDNNYLAWPGTIILQPTSPAFWKIIFQSTTSVLWKKRVLSTPRDAERGKSSAT